MAEILTAYTWWRFLDLPATTAGWAWLCFGLCGNLTFCTRFLLQWLYSEMHKESRIPVAFWWQSIVGTLILLIYFLHQRDLVGILGYLMNVIPYSRNLMLVYRKRRLEAIALEPVPVPANDR